MTTHPDSRRGRGRIAALVLAIGLLAWWVVRAHLAPRAVTRVHDAADVVSSSEQAEQELFLQRVMDESGVDIRFEILPGLRGESLEGYAVRMARELGIGRDADRRGLLFVYDVASRRLRIEVGAQLEPIMTDAFVGYLMREHVRSFFGAGNPELGIRTTLFMVQHRLREAVLGQSYDPRAVSYIEDTRRLALGGGASAAVGADRANPFLNRRQPSDSATLARFAPQPTPALTYERYLEWLARGGYQTDVTMFTPGSRQYLAALPMTRAFNDHLLMIEYGHPYRIDERGDLALLYFTTTPLLGPHFLRRTAEGWVMDVVAEVRDTKNYAGFWYTWGLVNTGDDFARQLGDRYADMGSILRVAGGDNRGLPSRLHPEVVLEPAPDPADTLVQVDVAEAAAQIEAAGPGTLVVLYSALHTGALETIADLAAECRRDGRAVLAYAVDQDPYVQWMLPEALRRAKAGLAPVHLRQWPAGRLTSSMAPLGIRVGVRWSIPLIAVRGVGGAEATQIEGIESLPGGAGPIRAACRAGT